MLTVSFQQVCRQHGHVTLTVLSSLLAHRPADDVSSFIPCQFVLLFLLLAQLHLLHKYALLGK